MYKMDYQEFVITGNLVDGNLTQLFKQPITIPKNAICEVKWVQLGGFSFTTGYKSRGYTIHIDLPITVQQTDVSDVGFERKVLLNIPPLNYADASADDPGGGIPAQGQILYEPHNPVVHYLRNNECQINQFTFKVRDLDQQTAQIDDPTNFRAYFCIKNGHADPRTGEKSAY